jgi:uncharacterized membrane protein YgaE (UPF0421/DUF939 family)
MLVRLLRRLAAFRIIVTLRPHISGLQLALRASVSAAAAIAIAKLFKLEHPIYALLAAVIVTDLAPSQSRRLAVHRIVATFVGAICGAALTLILPSGPIAVGASILLAMLLCQLVGVPDATKISGFICGIVVLEDSPEPWFNAAGRFLETILGVVVAVLVSYVPKLINIEEPEKQEG